MAEPAKSINDLLPPSVRKAADRSAEIQKALATPPNPETPAAPGAQPNTPPAGAQKSPETPPKVEKTPDEIINDTEEAYKKRFDVLKGKYDVEVPRLAKENSKLRQMQTTLLEENQTLRAENKDLKTSLEEAKAKTPAAPEAGTQHGEDLIDPEDYREYGAAFVKMAEQLRKVVESGAKKKAQPRQPEQPARTVDPGRQAFIAQVRKEVADLDALNNDPQLLHWLDAERDPVYGMPMRYILNQAEQRLDHEAVVKVFNQFKHDILGIPIPGFEKPDPNTPAPLKPPISPPPSVPGNPQNPLGHNSKIWTRAEIKQFYTDVTAGKYRGREADKKAIDADIMAAQSEGRIRG